MTIPECLDAYAEISKEVFHVEMLQQPGKLLSGNKFSGVKLEEAIKRVVEKYRGTTSAKMRDNPCHRRGGRSCNTSVHSLSSPHER